MFGSLRTRFILSHVLPILLLLPLLSFTLLYLLETRYFMVNIANEMVVQASLIGEIVKSDSIVWQDEEAAEDAVRQLQQQMPSQLPARIMLLDSEGRALASSQSEDAYRVAQTIDHEVEQRALAGEVAWDIQYSLDMGERVVDVAVPVLDSQGELLGIVRVSQGVAQLEERLSPLRWFVLGTFAIGLVLSAALAFFLANSLSASLLRLSSAVDNFSIDSPPEILPVSGSREMKSLISRYNEMAQSLHENEVTRRRLLAGVIHEVSRPLGGINAAAQLLSRRKSAEPELVHELAGEIETSVDDIQKQMDDLALLAQSESGNIQLQLEEVDIGQLLTSRCANTINRIHKEGLQLDINLSPGLPSVLADPARIAQVLSNLLDNARKYSPKGGRISVAADVDPTRGEPPMVVVRVSDSGPGIDNDEQDRIFQFFYRSPDQRKTTTGMGIGLALAQQLVLAHGGTLDVDSVMGQGATFILRLKAYPAIS